MLYKELTIYDKNPNRLYNISFGRLLYLIEQQNFNPFEPVFDINRKDITIKVVDIPIKNFDIYKKFLKHYIKKCLVEIEYKELYNKVRGMND